MDQLLSVEETARRLGGVSKHTVNKWLSEGKLQRTKVGSRTMIRESELLKVIEDGGKSIAPRRSMNRLLTIEQFAAATGWKPKTVRNKIWRRELEYVRIARSIRLKQETLDKLIDNGICWVSRVPFQRQDGHSSFAKRQSS